MSVSDAQLSLLDWLSDICKCLHQLVILVCFQNKILLYVCVIKYCKVTLCNLCQEYYLNDKWLLFCCITVCCNLLSLISYYPLFLKANFTLIEIIGGNK